MSELYQKIYQRMNNVQDLMESNKHITDPNGVLFAISNVSKFWPVLSEEDKEYLQAATYAIEEGKEWNIKNTK